MPDFCRRLFRSAIGGAFLLVITAATAPAQTAPVLDPQRPLAQYLRTAWARAQGLPQNTVNDVLQTHDGYLWATTGDGLVRFDGRRFTVFNTSTDPALGTDDFTTLLEDRHNTLWVGTTGGGLFSVRDNRLQPFTGGRLPNGLITDLLEEPDGTLWIATIDGLCRYADGALTTFTTAQGLPSSVVRSITRDRSGAIWVATQAGVARLERGRFITIATEPQLPSNETRVIYATRDGTVWIGTARGLVRYRDGTLTTLGKADGLSGELIRAILEDAVGTLWIGTQDGGINRLSGGRVESLRAADGFPSDDVRSFAMDTEGDLWVGTNVGGLVRLKQPKVTTYGTAEGLPHEVALPVAADRSGALWTGTYGGGVGRLANGRWTRYSTADGLSNDVVVSLAPSMRGGMWVGTRVGLDHVLDGRVTRYDRTHGLPDDAVLSLLEDRDGTLWVGTRRGVFRFASGRATRVDAEGTLGRAVIYAIHQARDGAIWFGTEGSGVVRLSGGTVTPVGADAGLANAGIYSITEDNEGALWFATNGYGVVRYRNGEFSTYHARDGLIDDTVFRILDDRMGNLWFSSNIGIHRIPRQQFDEFDARTRRRLTGEFFNEADGMRSAECNGGVQPAGWRTDDGILWFPTISGLVRIDPTALAATRRPPPVVLEQVVADGLNIRPGASVTIEPGVRTLEFRYTAISLRSPEEVRFRYRLEGFDSEWIEAGADRRTAYYTNLPPDTYRFQVLAADDSGIWNETGAVTAVTLQPYFSQTNTFYVLVVAAIGFVVFGLHRARVSGLRAREQELARLAEERRWALVALQESEAQFRTLFENVNEGVYRSTPDGRIVLANQSMARLLGYDTVEELLRVPTRDLYVDVDEYARLVNQVTETGEARAVEMRLRRRDGHEVVVLESVRRVRGGGDSLTYYEGALVDITERKHLEEQLLQLQRIESIGRLAGGVAHDVNNLLTPILGQAELLAEELPDDDRRRVRVEQIRKAALSARSFTRQLLAFSRRQILKKRVVNLNEALGDVQEILRRLIGEHIELRLLRAPDLKRVRVDAGQLEQVLMNLVVNARDAMPLGGTVTVETCNVVLDEQAASQRPGVAPGEYVVLAVTDTGPGISADVRQHLFEPFVTTNPQGTGLGLALVHGIVTQSGGHVVVESEPGKGAAFHVYLPAIDDAVVERAPAVRPLHETTGETILLVEDDEDVRTITAEMLERAGYHVLVATDAEHAQRIEADYGDPIDLLFTDVVMPGLGGPALAEILRRRRQGLKVLYTTGYIDNDVAHHGVLRPDVMVLEKPFTQDALLQTLHECLAAPAPADRTT